MFHSPQRFSGTGTIPVWFVAGLALAVAGMLVAPERATAQFVEKDYATGFGLIYGEGRTEEEANSKRFGFTTRRIKDKDRIGSLSLIYEEHTDGLPHDLLDPALREADVELRYRTLFAEIKRYFPLGGAFHIYWGLRGGYSRIDGRVDSGGGNPKEFDADQVAPLWLLALPLVMEHPGFLLLAFLDGAAIGMTFDVVPERLWLEYQVGAALIPNYRDQFVAVDDLTLVTQTLQLVLVF